MKTLNQAALILTGIGVLLFLFGIVFYSIISGIYFFIGSILLLSGLVGIIRNRR